MLICGIDPGLRGAFALLDEDSVIFEVMPVIDGVLDLRELNRLFRVYADQITHAYLELASLRPMQSGQFTVGRGFGNLEGMMACLDIPFTLVRPQEWSKEYVHGITERDIPKRKKLIKQARLATVKRLFPLLDLRENSNCKVDHDGIVDALLIAHYGRRKRKEGIK